MTKQKVYIETSVLSYLAARPARDKIIAAHQMVTKEWWKNESNQYELCISEIVLREVAKGDTAAAIRRQRYAYECTVLTLMGSVLQIAERFMKQGSMPKRAAEDILHIAVATVHHVDYLLSWNCAHIANAVVQKKLSKIAAEAGFELPILCTPLELFGGMP